MRPIPVSLRPYLVLFLFALVATAAAAGDLRQPALSAKAGVARLELATGEPVAVRLPAGAEPASSAALGDRGWVMTALRGREIVVLTGEGAAASTLPTPPAARP